MIEYALKGQTITLSVETSRLCGHLTGVGGEAAPDAARSSAVRREVRADVQVLVDLLGKSIVIYASHSIGLRWQVDVVEPTVHSTHTPVGGP